MTGDLVKTQFTLRHINGKAIPGLLLLKLIFTPLNTLLFNGNLIETDLKFVESIVFTANGCSTTPKTQTNTLSPLA